jgi:Ca-activated chloride channel homolog
VGEIVDELDLKGRNEELVNELVQLATEHGILTPYTSFLADETSEVRDLATNNSRTLMEVEALADTSGQYGFLRRVDKLSHQTASRAPTSAAAGGAAAAVPELKTAGGGYFGSNVTFYCVDGDRYETALNCRQIGRKTFFQRGERLVDSTVTEEQENSAKKIERFSREYFDLIEKHGKHVAQYVALDEPVVINLGGETYAW